ncbi:ABC transporter substrate-binding protein [Segnochrobactraceae bacterium EtOH-i3]
MKFLTRLAAATALLAATALGAQAETVRIGTEGAYPPFNYFDADKNLQGFDIDIAKALCDKMKVECVFVAQDWDGIIPALQAKKYDAIIASMSITPEREKVVAFTDKYYFTPARFVTAKEGGVTDTSPAGLKGKTIGAQSSTVSANYLEDVYKDSTIKLYPTQEEAYADIVAGRLDTILADSTLLYEWLEKTPDGKGYMFVGEEIRDPKYFGDGIGIAVRKDDTGLKDKFNKAIVEIRADGTYQKINAKYFPFSIY